jgi:hypothetical protein
MNQTTLYVILAVALGLLVGFVLVMYLMRPAPPTFNADAVRGPALSRLAERPSGPMSLHPQSPY